MINKSILLFTFWFFISLSSFSQITTLTIQPNSTQGRDAYTHSASSGTNTGAQSVISKAVGPTARRRIYIEFDIASQNIPANAIITDSKIELRLRYSSHVPSTTEIDAISHNWSESSITWNFPPNVASYPPTITVNPISLGNYWYGFDVTSLVQHYVNYPFLDYGFRLKSDDENLTSSGLRGATYCSSDYYHPPLTRNRYHPKLVIEYVLPLEITLNSLTHADTPTSSNGSITIDVDEGDGTYSYQWIDGSTGNDISGETSATISNLQPGWYGVEVTDGLGNISYMAFVVGAKCGVVQVDFQPDGRFVDDAYVSDGTTPPNSNYGSNSFIMAESYYFNNPFLGVQDYIREFSFKNLLIIPDNIHLENATQTFFGSGHVYTSGNSTKLGLITENWSEDLITWETKPNLSMLVYDIIPSTTSSSENVSLNHTSLYSNYQLNPIDNHGYTIKLNYIPLGTTGSRLRFCSSEWGTVDYRPKLVLKLGDICTYAKPQKRLDAETYHPINGYIYFEFQDEYLDENGLLNYTLLDENRKDAFSGSAPDLDVEIGDNRCSIDVSILSAGVYILEITNDKNEEFLMRFKKP